MATRSRKRIKSQTPDLEKIYLCNSNFVPPKDQNLETIFEEPREQKDGTKMLTSKIKYKRYLSFDPTMNKIQKRKRKAKKCNKKLKMAYRVTRSTPETSEPDISLDIDVFDCSSTDSENMTSLPDRKPYDTKQDNVHLNLTGPEISDSHEECEPSRDVDVLGSSVTHECSHNELSESSKSLKANDETQSTCELS